MVSDCGNIKREKMGAQKQKYVWHFTTYARQQYCQKNEMRNKHVVSIFVFLGDFKFKLGGVHACACSICVFAHTYMMSHTHTHTHIHTRTYKHTHTCRNNTDAAYLVLNQFLVSVSNGI